MKTSIARIRSLFFSMLIVSVLFLAAACGPIAKSNGASMIYGDDYRFVPRIHVEDNIGATIIYHQCSYDLYYEGYWCRVNE